MTPEQKAARRAIKCVTPDTDIAGVPLTEEQKATIRATEARWAKDDATTDLIAQAEAALDGVTLGPWTAMLHDDGMMAEIVRFGSDFTTIADAYEDADARFIAWTRAGVPALIARVRELEGERERLALAICGGEDAPGYANAQTVETLEKLARDSAKDMTQEIDRTLAAEATVATLTAQVEAMRGAAGEVLRISDRDHEAWHRLRAEIKKSEAGE
jgi:hypothetical protein